MAREKDGRFSAGLDRVCVCGCRLGDHDAAKPHACQHCDECESFKKGK